MGRFQWSFPITVGFELSILSFNLLSLLRLADTQFLHALFPTSFFTVLILPLISLVVQSIPILTVITVRLTQIQLRSWTFRSYGVVSALQITLTSVVLFVHIQFRCDGSLGSKAGPESICLPILIMYSTIFTIATLTGLFNICIMEGKYRTKRREELHNAAVCQAAASTQSMNGIGIGDSPFTILPTIHYSSFTPDAMIIQPPPSYQFAIQCPTKLEEIPDYYKNTISSSQTTIVTANETNDEE